MPSHILGDCTQPQFPRRLAPLFSRERKACIYDGQSDQTIYSTQESNVGEMVCKMPNSTVMKLKRKRANTERRREQCRNNQARYRDRQRGFIRDLEDCVTQLRDEVHKLSLEHYTLCYGAQTKNNVWSVVVEYFRLFRHGCLVPTSTASTPPMPHFLDQECFLRAAMVPDVALGELIGVDALIQQWQRYSTYFGHLHFHLERMEELPFGVMVTSSTLSLTITESTLRCVFPHLLTSYGSECGDYGTENFLMCSRLLGQRLDCKCSVRFVWDDLTKRVTRLDCTMNLLTPLLSVLGNLQDVNHVLEKALITPANLIGEL